MKLVLSLLVIIVCVTLDNDIFVGFASGQSPPDISEPTTEGQTVLDAGTTEGQTKPDAGTTKGQTGTTERQTIPEAGTAPIPLDTATIPDEKKMTTTTKGGTKKRRTTPPRLSFTDNCEYIAKYCLLAYETGKLCARTLYNTYMTFPTYCLMDYVNCKERYDVWQVAYMGECFDLTPMKQYANYPYWDDSFLDSYYAME